MIGQSSVDNPWITSDAAYRALAGQLTLRYAGRGVRVEYLPAVDSTNSWLKAACTDALPPGPTVVFTRHQTAGRGTRGRDWLQVAGRDAAVSIAVVLPGDRVPDLRLSLSIGGALAQAIEDSAGCPVRVKWPNDLLLAPGGVAGGVTWRKFAGILLETATAAEGRRVLVAGVGVNANSSPADLPGELRERVTSLSHELSRPVDVCRLTGRMVAVLVEAMSAGTGPGLTEWFTRDITAGTPYMLSRGGVAIPVVARRVEQGSGCLVVADSNGIEYSVASYTELEYPPSPG